MVVVTWDPHEAARCVDALLLAAEVEAVRNPILARHYRNMADDLGDGLDRAVPAPSGFTHPRVHRGVRSVV